MSKKNKIYMKQYRKIKRVLEQEMKHFNIPQKIAHLKVRYNQIKTEYESAVILEMLNELIGYDETINFINQTMQKGVNN